MIGAKPELGGHASSLRATAAADWSQLARRELIGRVVASPTFARSERLSSLLTYVCDMALKGRESEINEQKIGHAVFGRSLDYDSSIDGIVRTQASRLRQRLELYFHREGAEEPVRIIIPRGGYVPVFEPRPARAPALPETDPQSPAGSLQIIRPESAASGGPRSFRNLLPWALCMALAAIVVVMAVRERQGASPAQANTTPHPLWNRIFAANRPTLVVTADSGLVMFHNMSAQSVDLDQYLQGEYRAQPANLPIYGPGTPTEVWQANLANRRYTSMVDLECVLSLQQRARASRGELQVRYARDLRPNDFKSGNVILLGEAEANPWVQIFERKMNFVFHADYATNVSFVINRSPQRGEPARWESALRDPEHRVYGVVAYVPNLGGNGDVLIIEGTSMSGTEGARDFLMNDSQLLPFLKKIQHPDGTIPHFELLVGTQNVGSSAAPSNLLAWRTTN